MPSQELPGDLAVADDLDADADLDGDDLEGEVDLADLEDLSEDDLGDDVLVVETWRSPWKRRRPTWRD